LLGLFLAGGIRKKDVVKGSIALSFDEEIGVIVQSSLDLLDHELMLF